MLGNLEDAEPERRTPAPKKTLEAFLEEFEARLHDHPGEAATSATAALEGRAEGSWRTPVEGTESRGRRLPRRLLSSQATPPAVDVATPGSSPAEPTPASGADVVAPAATPVKHRRRHRRHHRHR